MHGGIWFPYFLCVAYGHWSSCTTLNDLYDCNTCKFAAVFERNRLKINRCHLVTYSPIQRCNNFINQVVTSLQSHARCGFVTFFGALASRRTSAGRLRLPAQQAAGTLPAGWREGFALGAGLGSTFLATRNFGVRLSLDYDMAPLAVAGAGRRLHLVTISLEACAVF